MQGPGICTQDEARIGRKTQYQNISNSCTW